MSTFSPKRPESQPKVRLRRARRQSNCGDDFKDRYSPSGPNVTFSRAATPQELPGTAVYGVQETPVKKPQKAQFEKSKAEYNEKASRVRPTIDTTGRKKVEAHRLNPIAMNPSIPRGHKKDTPTFRTSPGNPLGRQRDPATSNSNAFRTSTRFAARLKFEETHSNSPSTDENKYAGQHEARQNVREAKVKEKTILKEHPHGATQGIIHHTRPDGLSLPRLGFGGSSCRS